MLDCGSKVLSSDGACGFAGAATGFGVILGPDGQPDPGLVIERLSEEHGVVRVTGPPACASATAPSFIANHACGFANLSNGYTVVEGDELVDAQKVEPWEFDGQGSSGDLEMHGALIRAIREKQPINEGVRLAEATMTGIMGRMSAYTGRALKWDWAMNASKLDLRPAKYEMGPLPVEPVAMPGRTPLI